MTNQKIMMKAQAKLKRDLERPPHFNTVDNIDLIGTETEDNKVSFLFEVQLRNWMHTRIFEVTKYSNSYRVVEL